MHSSYTTKFVAGEFILDVQSADPPPQCGQAFYCKPTSQQTGVHYTLMHIYGRHHFDKIKLSQGQAN